jgi:hypothetical protein
LFIGGIRQKNVGIYKKRHIRRHKSQTQKVSASKNAGKEFFFNEERDCGGRAAKIQDNFAKIGRRT